MRDYKRVNNFKEACSIVSNSFLSAMADRDRRNRGKAQQVNKTYQTEPAWKDKFRPAVSILAYKISTSRVSRCMLTHCSLLRRPVLRSKLWLISACRTCRASMRFNNWWRSWRKSRRSACVSSIKTFATNIWSKSLLARTKDKVCAWALASSGTKTPTILQL